ncbi:MULTISPECIES: protein kinase family protein [Bacillaceae]|uniref:protein kinase domain-containing protein n=1 Tax=Bacillaceae TaxID=186817 RepID=UPI00119CDBB2|nr:MULTISPECIES: protein kinase family protein [Bacillaceae]MCM3125869.1 protein kinase family protein [Mesobacillus sp. MER 33]MCM3235915.1 protein kinase family protein [Mesobacillus sp. MER 48]
MMNPSLKNLCKVIPGTIIEGKWHHNRYTIIKELGFGANGIVYLARHDNKQVALKMSDNGMSVTSEVNVLKAFAKVQGSALGPSLLDVDDWERPGKKVSFYVMEFIKGPDFLAFLEQKGPDWTGVMILQLLADLQLLHDNGWVFGDLKPENLIVTGPPARIRCIDVGGTTMQGRSIKEFTEFFDRGYWGLGSRKAEPGYDLFAVGMIMVNTVYPKRFTKNSGGINEIMEKVKQSPELRRYEKVIYNALSGKYRSAKEMRNDLLRVHQPDAPSRNTRQQKPAPQKQTQPSPARSTVRRSSSTASGQTRKGYNKRRKKSSTLETATIILIISLLYFFYIYSQIT